MAEADSTRLARVETTLEHIKVQVDKLIPLAQHLVQIQADQAAHSASVARAHARIDEGEKEDTLLHNRVDKAMEAIRTAKAELQKWLWLGTGMLVGVGAVWTLVAIIIKAEVLQALAAIATR